MEFLNHKKLHRLVNPNNVRSTTQANGGSVFKDRFMEAGDTLTIKVEGNDIVSSYRKL